MSWIGNQVSNLGGALNLPEFGISESINSIGQQPTNWNTNTPLNNYVQSNPGTVNTGNIGQVLGTSMLAPGNAAGIAEFNANQTSTGGSSSGGGSTGGGGGSSAPDLSNPSKQTDYARSLGYDTWDQMVNAQNEVKNRESQIRNTINSGYDQYSNRLNEMLPFFQGQQTDQLGALDNSYQTIQQGLDQGYQSGIDKLGIARKQVGSTVANSVEDI